VVFDLETILDCENCVRGEDFLVEDLLVEGVRLEGFRVEGLFLEDCFVETFDLVLLLDLAVPLRRFPLLPDSDLEMLDRLLEPEDRCPFPEVWA
jgi:hypothetical protein